MACSHRVTGKTPCLECFYEALGHDDSAVQRLSATVLGSEGRALCLGSRLLWRTSFLKRCTDFLASAHSSAAPQLINMLTRMVAEECLGQASVSCSVERHAAVGGMLLEALVAHVAQHCTQKAPGLAQLFQLLESILEAFGAAPAALDTLSRSLESSSPVLAALVSVPDDGSGGGLLLRLAERGGKELSPHLARESRRLAHSLAEAQPGSQLATTLLALYRMCALHPELFESLLSGDLTANAESIAVGLSRHLACEVSALRLAAAELAEDFAAFFEGAVEGWMRKAHLAQWLVEACRRGEDLGARAAACRALGRLDEPRLQTAAADALMDACSFALSVTAPVGEKRQVLQMAAESLSRCPGSGAFAPQQLVAILRAAVDTEGDLLEDCLEPVYFCVTHRPMDSEMSISCLAELLDATTALARQDLMQDFMSETLGQIMVMLSDIVWSRARSLCAESRHDGRLQGLPELDLLIRAAELLGRGSLRKAELVRALAAALWPALELGASFSEEQAAAFIKCCLQLDYLVPKLMDNEVLLAEDGPEGAAEELAAGQLMAVLLIPFLSVDAVSLQPLVPPSELQRLCSALLRSEDAWLARAAAAAAAETDLEEAELDRLAMGLPPLPLRAVVLLTCAVGRCAQKAAGFACGFAGEKLALAWGPLLAETRRSMAEPNAQEEWRLLKNLLPNGRNQLITALGWLLASAEEAEDAKDILLRAIELECASPEKEDWRWLSNCLPSPLWMAQRLEVLLGHALEDPAAGCGMLALITLCLADVKAAAVIVSSHAVAGIAMKWQRSASQPGDARLIEGIGLFMLQQLAAAPAGALQHSPVLAILLETLQSPSGCCLLPELAALAHFRAWDVPRLRELDLGQLEGVDQSQHDPETEELHGDAVAWAQLASSLLALRASKPKLPNEPDWARPADGPTTAFRLLTLSACLLRCPAVLGMQCSGSLLRGFADLICAETAQGGCPDAVDWSVCVTNAAALAILGLLGSDISHPLNRSETLHSEKVARSLQSAVERLLDFQSEGAEEEQCIKELPEEPRWLSEPCLLLLLLLLRAEPGWLSNLDLQKLQSLLAAFARSKRLLGAQRLLLLRLAEELLYQTSACHQAVLRQLLEEESHWDLAKQELREKTAVSEERDIPCQDMSNDDVMSSEASDEELDLMSLGQQARQLRRAQGSCLPPSSSKGACFWHLHRALCSRFCASLAGGQPF